MICYDGDAGSEGSVFPASAQDKTGKAEMIT